jgi:hypothetical protein
LAIDADHWSILGHASMQPFCDSSGITEVSLIGPRGGFTSVEYLFNPLRGSPYRSCFNGDRWVTGFDFNVILLKAATSSRPERRD